MPTGEQAMRATDSGDGMAPFDRVLVAVAGAFAISACSPTPPEPVASPPPSIVAEAPPRPQLPDRRPWPAAAGAAWAATDNAAGISNGQAALAVVCDRNSVRVQFDRPAAASIGATATLRFQVSMLANAYALDPTGEGRPVFRLDVAEVAADRRTFLSDDQGDDPSLLNLVDALRRGVSASVGADGLRRAEIFPLAGARTAIDGVLAACAGPTEPQP